MNPPVRPRCVRPRLLPVSCLGSMSQHRPTLIRYVTYQKDVNRFRLCVAIHEGRSTNTRYPRTCAIYGMRRRNGPLAFRARLGHLIRHTRFRFRAEFIDPPLIYQISYVDLAWSSAIRRGGCDIEARLS